MTIIIPHHSQRQEVIGRIDKAVDDLLAGGAGNQVALIDPKKEWNGSTMTFSVTGRMGFIKVPLSGSATVDDTNVTVECELPAMVKNFIGEPKVRAGIEAKMKEIVSA